MVCPYVIVIRDVDNQTWLLLSENCKVAKETVIKGFISPDEAANHIKEIIRNTERSITDLYIQDVFCVKVTNWEKRIAVHLRSRHDHLLLVGQPLREVSHRILYKSVTTKIEI